MSFTTPEFVSTTINAQERIPKLGGVEADLTADKWKLSLPDPVPPSAHGSASMRGRFSFQIKMDSKSHMLTYLLNQNCIDFIQEIRARQERHTQQRNKLNQAGVLACKDAKSTTGMFDQLEKFISLDNIVDLAMMAQRQGERVFPISDDDETMMQAMIARHQGLLDDLSTMLRDMPNGMAFLRKLIRSKEEQTVRMALSISERVGQLELQQDIRKLAANDSLPDNLRQHAYALLTPEHQWRFWDTAGSGTKHARRDDQ